MKANCGIQLTRFSLGTNKQKPAPIYWPVYVDPIMNIRPNGTLRLIGA